MRGLLTALSIVLLGFAGDAAAAVPAQAIVAAADLPTGPAQEIYDRAFGFLRQGDYPAARRGFADLLKNYPRDRLAANAQYWLAEIYSVQGNLEAAAKAFAAAYENYPGSLKASESLVKLGRTYAALGRKADACAAFARVLREDTAAPALKNLARNDARKLSCDDAD